MRKIGSNGDGPGQYRTIYDICSDEEGNLYVPDYRKSCVQVFSNGGEFLRSFDCDADGVKRLKGPHSVCVSGQFVYITNFCCPSVSVFTTDGGHVATFGQSDGDLDKPCGVCVDKDGFVYVCDFSKNRLQIF